MIDFSDRERAFEAKYARDEALRFRVQARGARLFGQWIAARLGLGTEDANRYIFQLIDLGTGSPNDASLVARAAKDLAHHNQPADLSELQDVLNRFLSEAKRHLART
jgi:hypothetical protein